MSKEVVSRRYLEKLRISLQEEGDDRLGQAMDECDVTLFVLDWVTCLVAAVLLPSFVLSAFLGHGWDCLAIAGVGALLGIGNRVISRSVLRHYNRRFYEVLPTDLRWCFRQTP